MAEYIKREYAIDAVLDVYYDTPDIDLSGEKFEAAILKIQAADVAPVVRGRWEEFPEDWRNQMIGNKCSLCGYEYFGSLHNYCPNCGCKMDLEG